MNDEAWKEAKTLTDNCTHGLDFAETAEHYADVRSRIRACIVHQIHERDEARARVKELEAAVYHTAPGELEFGGEGWTWKQQTRANEDRVKELEARITQLETAMTGTLGPLERCGLLAVADNVRVVIGTRTTLGGTTNANEKARNP